MGEYDLTDVTKDIAIIKNQLASFKTIPNKVEESKIKILELETLVHSEMRLRNIEMGEINKRLTNIENNISWIVKGIIMAILTGIVSMYFNLLTDKKVASKAVFYKQIENSIKVS